MRRRVVSSGSLLSIVLSTILSLSAIHSGIGIAKADSVIATMSVGSFPYAVAFNPNNRDMYVINQAGGGINSTISIIDSATNHVIKSITVGIRSTDIAFDPNNGYMYVTNAGSNTVSIIDSTTNHVIDTVHVGAFPESIGW